MKETYPKTFKFPKSMKGFKLGLLGLRHIDGSVTWHKQKASGIFSKQFLRRLKVREPRPAVSSNDDIQPVPLRHQQRGTNFMTVGVTEINVPFDGGAVMSPN